jgi:hypothetical protein
MNLRSMLIIREHCDGTCDLVGILMCGQEEDMGRFPDLRQAVGRANWHMRNRPVERGLSIKLYGDN